jgi:hypothetical protein
MPHDKQGRAADRTLSMSCKCVPEALQAVLDISQVFAVDGVAVVALVNVPQACLMGAYMTITIPLACQAWNQDLAGAGVDTQVTFPGP